MVEIITALLTSVGFITCIIFGYALLKTIFMFIVKSVQQLKYKHEYEHRFDKPPIAKCYCVDCAYYSKDSGRCLCHDGWVMNDTGFCSEAYPRKRNS